jgi:hypothetical protein
VQQPGDDEAGDDEEDVDPKKAAWEPVAVHVKDNDGQHRRARKP